MPFSFFLLMPTECQVKLYFFTTNPFITNRNYFNKSYYNPAPVMYPSKTVYYRIGQTAPSVIKGYSLIITG